MAHIYHVEYYLKNVEAMEIGMQKKAPIPIFQGYWRYYKSIGQSQLFLLLIL